MYQTALNNQSVIIDFTDTSDRTTGLTLNGEPFAWDLVKLSDRTFHILHQDRSYTAEVLDLNAAENTVRLKINGHLHEVQLKDRFDLLLEQMGMSRAAGAKAADL